MITVKWVYFLIENNFYLKIQQLNIFGNKINFI